MDNSNLSLEAMFGISYAADDDDETAESSSGTTANDDAATTRKRVRSVKEEAPSTMPMPQLTTANRKQLHDVYVELPAGQGATTVSRDTDSRVAATPLSATHYDMTQQILAERTSSEQHNASVGQVTNMATLTNHFLQRVDRTAHSQALPNTSTVHGSALGRAFFMAWLTKTSHKVLPVSEDTEAMRKLHNNATFLARKHIEKMTRTRRPTERPCVNGEGCVGPLLRDSYRRKIGGETLVSFRYPDEDIRFNEPGGRAALDSVLIKRQCVLCIIRGVNKHMTEMRAQNTALDPGDIVSATPFYVHVDVAGEYPLGATIGADAHTFEGLLYNVPRWSLDDWVAIESPGGEQFTAYVQTSVPAYPVDRQLVEDYVRQGFLEASDGVPNVYLYRCLAKAANDDACTLYAFVFGAPFTDAVLDERRFAVARAQITAPDPVPRGEGAHWCPLAIDDCQSRLYCALVLRLAFLDTMLDRTADMLTERVRHTANALAELRRVRHALLLWRDAHSMLAIAIDQFGKVPDDDTDVWWNVLIERYAPDINMFFHSGELPSLYSHILRTPFFTAALGESATDPIVNALRKALPKRCQTRDSTAKDGDQVSRNPAYFCFLKTVLVAALLGVYERADYPAGARMRRGLYELFFFKLDARLISERHPRTDGALGGSEKALRADYALDRDSIDLSGRRSGARVVTPSYDAAVAANFRSAKIDKKGANAAADAEQVAADIASKARARNSRRRGGRRGVRAPADVVSATTVSSAAATAAAGRHMTAREREIQRAFALGFATSRLNMMQARGLYYYQQCLVAGTLPKLHSGAKNEDVVAPPVPHGMRMTSAYALRHMLPCDERMPELLFNDRIIFEWMNACIETRTEGARVSVSCHYIFQTALTMSVRAFLIESLHLAPELRSTLCARTGGRWAQWENAVFETLDRTRHSLTLATDVKDARPGAFLSHHTSYRALTAARTAPLNTLYRVRQMSFMEQLQISLDKWLYKEGVERTVDRVMPLEYEVLMRESLFRYAYPRRYTRGTATARNASALASLADDATVGDDGSALPPICSSPYREFVATALPAYTIAPCAGVPRDGATFAEVRAEFAERGLFPLRAFRGTPFTIDAINVARRNYAASASVSDITNLIRTIADVSMFQLQLMHAFARSVNTYLNVYTFRLPRYLEAQHEDLLVARYTTHRGRLLPPHLTRSLVCLRCRRFAGFVETRARKNLASALGTSCVKVTDRTFEDEVHERVLERGALLAPDQLRGEVTLKRALTHRALRATSFYDRYCIDPIDARTAAIVAQQTDDALVVGSLEKRAARVRVVLEREMAAVAEEMRARPKSPPPVARAWPRETVALVGEHSDTPLADMLHFDRAVWRDFDRRTEVTHLLYGHNMATSDASDVALLGGVLRCTDNDKVEKQELKKQKKLREVAVRVANDPKRARSCEESMRMSIIAMTAHRLCANESLHEFDSREALVCDQPRASPHQHIDFYISCLVCGVSVLRSRCEWRGAALVCLKCYRARAIAVVDEASGAGQQRLEPSAALAAESAGESALARLTHDLLWPDGSVLSNTHVLVGAKCDVPNCIVVSGPLTTMFAKEVYVDTCIGAERIGYMYVCARHAKDRAWMFLPTLPLMPTLSMFNVLCLEQPRSVTWRHQCTDYLPHFMDRVSAAQNVGRGVTESALRKKKAGKEAKRREDALAKLRAEAVEAANATALGNGSACDEDGATEQEMMMVMLGDDE